MKTNEILDAAQALVVWALLLGAPVLLVVRRRRRRQALVARWERLRSLADGRGQLALVRSVYQHARRGSKAILQWSATGVRQDAWFEGWQASPGMYVVICGSSGWGPHHQRSTFYVGRDQVLATAPPAARRAWMRAQRRREPMRRGSALAGRRG